MGAVGGACRENPEKYDALSTWHAPWQAYRLAEEGCSEASGIEIGLRFVGIFVWCIVPFCVHVLGPFWRFPRKTLASDIS